MGSVAPIIGVIDSVCPEPLNLTPTLSPLHPTTPSYVHAYQESLDDIREYNPSFDPYYAT